MYSIYDGLDGTVGQFYRDITFNEFPLRSGMRAQASARGGAATAAPDRVYVIVMVQQAGRLPSFQRTIRERFTPLPMPQLAVAQGWVSRANFNAARNWLYTQPGGSSLVPNGENRYVLTVTRAQLQEVLRLLGIVQGYELWPDPRPAPTQFRLFGVAAVATGVGYALGGLPGAAVGAAAALIKGKFDATRVG